MLKRAQVVFRKRSRKSLATFGSVKLDNRAAGELERADVECVGLAVLGEPRSDDPVAASAIIGGIVVDAFERSPQRAHHGHHVLAHPMHNGLGKTSADERGRRHRHLRPVGEPHRLEPHHVVHDALAGSGQCRQRGSDRQFGQSRSRQAEGAGASSGVASGADGTVEISAGRGRGNGTTAAAAKSQGTNAQRGAKRVRAGRNFTVAVSARIATL